VGNDLPKEPEKVDEQRASTDGPRDHPALYESANEIAGEPACADRSGLERRPGPAEQGTHAALLADGNSLYKRLYELQRGLAHGI